MEKTGQWERVKELFDAALGRSTDERDEFLRQACGGDVSLCNEVKSLLSPKFLYGLAFAGLG